MKLEKDLPSKHRSTRSPKMSPADEAAMEEAIHAAAQDDYDSANRKANAVAYLKKCCQKLAPLGRLWLTAEYSGESDEVFEFEVFAQASNRPMYGSDPDDPRERAFQIRCVPEARWLPDTNYSPALIENAMRDLLTNDWASEAGGRGDISINITSGTIIVSHTAYYRESTQHVTSW